jgi:hypothetical protein
MRLKRAATFPNSLKIARVAPIHIKKTMFWKRAIIGLLVFFLPFQKSLKQP